MNPWLKHVLQGLGGGTALAIGYAAIQAVEKNPAFLPQLLNGGVLIPVLVFSFGTLALIRVDARFSQFTELQTRNVAANEQLAAGVNALVTKDDRKMREQELLLDHMGIQIGKILEHLERHSR